MNKTAFYINMGSYKVEDYGTKLTEDLLYTKIDNTFTVFHIPTGKSVATGKTLKEAKILAFERMENNKEFVKEAIENSNLSDLPIKHENISKERKLEVTLGLKQLPYDNIVLGMSNKLVIDFVELDKKLMKRKNYDENKSVNENIIAMYGKEILTELENFNVTFDAYLV